MHEQPDIRYRILQDRLRPYGTVLIAFSGGIDSSLLAYTARQTLGRDNVLAVTAYSETFPENERNEAREFAERYDIAHRIIRTRTLQTINEHDNDKDRCYHCKHALFTVLRSIAEQEGYSAVLEGSNTDDDSDYRPGRRAVQELGIQAPLRDAGLRKQDIRDLSRSFGLPNWDKPAYACLTSRFPYKVTITKAALEQVEKAEQYLRSLGFKQCRVRHYGKEARVEVEKERLSEAQELKEQITKALAVLGFLSATIDENGYRMGSMNEPRSASGSIQ